MARGLQSIRSFLDLEIVNTKHGTSGNLLLFHNSKGGFIGKPEIKYSRETCDFGQGIYLSPNFSRVNNFVNNDKSVIYSVEVSLAEVKYYVFQDIYLFYIYCICNRTRCYEQMPIIVKEYIDNVNGHDLVIGETLDGTKMMASLFAFMNNQFDLSFTNKQIKLNVLGLQYCVKSQSLLDTLHFNEIKLDSVDYKLDNDLQDYSSILTQEIPRGVTFNDLVEIVRGKL